MKKIIILGATGNGLFIADMINQCNKDGSTDDICLGFVNDIYETYEGFPVLGKFCDFKKLIAQNYFFITAISVDSRPGRRDFYKSLEIPQERFYSFIHPSSFVSSNVKIGPGVIIGPNVSINAHTKIHEGARIMPGASIGANCCIEQYSFVSVNSCIADGCIVKAGCHIGLNATVSEDITIGDSSLLGMGSFLNQSVNSNEVWVGNPAKLLKKRF